jgi:hypothetical protein
MKTNRSKQAVLVSVLLAVGVGVLSGRAGGEEQKAVQYSRLFAWWKLNEGKGLVAADASGNKRDGTLTTGVVAPPRKPKPGETPVITPEEVVKSGPTWTNDAGRVALSFDGFNDMVECPTHLENLTLPFSFTFWVKQGANSDGHQQNIFGNQASRKGEVGGLVMQDGGGEEGPGLYRFNYHGKNGGWYNPEWHPVLSPGKWLHLAVVCNGERAFYYINGVQKLTEQQINAEAHKAPKGAFVPNTNLTFRLGTGIAQGRFFHGMLSDFRIYRTALTPEEVQAVMKEGAVEPAGK